LFRALCVCSSFHGYHMPVALAFVTAVTDLIGVSPIWR
jgi:hypothetical protein